MRRRPLVYSLGALLLSSLSIASAQNAFTSRPMNVRAGPDPEYPLVAQLDAGTPLDVHGCLSDWSWCDVSFEDNRGWIYSGGVSFVYQGERVPLYSYGPNLGLPIVAFSLSVYWGDYYRGRPWYGQRDEWEHRHFPHHMRPSGRQYAGPPPMPHGHPETGARPEYRGAEQGRAASHPAPAVRVHPTRPSRPQATPPSRPHAAAPPSRPHAAPSSTSHGHPPANNHGQPRGGEHGHPPAQKREPKGHPPQDG